MPSFDKQAEGTLLTHFHSSWQEARGDAGGCEGGSAIRVVVFNTGPEI